jgi:hypothetical protein
MLLGVATPALAGHGHGSGNAFGFGNAEKHGGGHHFGTSGKPHSNKQASFAGSGAPTRPLARMDNKVGPTPLHANPTRVPLRAALIAIDRSET